jgi:transcriptional regulator of acetoin/glycerol metabolism
MRKIENRRVGEPAIPDDPSKTLKEIAKAWEDFVTLGKFSSVAPRPVIVEGWRRSRHLGIDPRAGRAPTVASLEEIEAILARADIGRAGKQVLDSFAAVVEGTGHAIILADAEGHVVYWAGRRGLQGMLEQINLAPGGDWSETAVGPNGVGTPIALGRPEVIFGAEHYCQSWHPWVCYGSPVREPGTGRILGGVDITGPAGKVQAHTLALTVSIARSIEQLLLVYQLQRREALQAAARNLERKWPAEGILAVDESGRVVDTNCAAAKTLGLSPAALQHAAFGELMPELWTSVQQSVESGSAREEKVSVRMPSGQARATLCRVEPVVREGRTVGSVLIVSSRSGAYGRVRRGTGPATPDLASSKYTFADLLGHSPVLHRALSLARAAARGPHFKPVLLTGESGTGKELVAHAIHAESPRAHGPFIVVNCGAFPRELIESELFGYASGAFTGARREGQMGKFEAAHGGTIFLDEIDSLPLELQTRFLRVLEDGVVVRLGGTNGVSVDARVVAACSVDLRCRVQESTFRLDLFHRLSVVEIVLPSLRERPEDVPLLAAAFLEEECAAAGRDVLALSPEVVDCLRAYPWPGNIRELRNVCARWVLTVEGREVRAEDVPRHLREAPCSQPGDVATASSLRQIGDAIIRQTLAECGKDVGEAARRLKVAKTTIYRRLKKWDLE